MRFYNKYYPTPNPHTKLNPPFNVPPPQSMKKNSYNKSFFKFKSPDHDVDSKNSELQVELHLLLSVHAVKWFIEQIHTQSYN